MKFASLEHYSLSAWRVAACGVALASAAWLATSFAVGGVLGGAKSPLLYAVAALVFYAVVSVPRRMMDRERACQAREAIPLSCAIGALLEVTRSNARTLVLLTPGEGTIAAQVRKAARATLLGEDVGASVERAARALTAYSAAGALRMIGANRAGSANQDDEEVRGLELSSELGKETKLPTLMTASFFAPILLVLYAVFAHLYGWGSLAELVALEFVILDVAFYFTATGGDGK
ncbi:MAG: hypothetical protein JRN43_04220 [Nitrososphaerota archaeon]|nr:hypothetical protein [Nitrososphaerota archaeon]MDG7019504.1 hypothetical protein [Nitrososphaerota archaeon]